MESPLAYISYMRCSFSDSLHPALRRVGTPTNPATGPGKITMPVTILVGFQMAGAKAMDVPSSAKVNRRIAGPIRRQASGRSRKLWRSSNCLLLALLRAAKTPHGPTGLSKMSELKMRSKRLVAQPHDAHGGEWAYRSAKSVRGILLRRRHYAR
jgi:hypothetical protein